MRIRVGVLAINCIIEWIYSKDHLDVEENGEWGIKRCRRRGRERRRQEQDFKQ